MKGFQRITAPLAQKSAVALGFFDGVHLGHRAVLGAAARCAAEQELLACAFTFAADSVPVKQGVPLSYLYTDTQKAELMQDCGIHRVYCPAFSELCGLDGEAFCRQALVELLHAQEVFCGGDFRFGAKAAWNIDSLREFGSQFGFGVHQVAPVLCGGEKISSTAIRQAIRAGKPEQATNLLGVPYHVSGRVIHGAALGRTKAVPTINIPFAAGQLVPRYGVYVSRTHTPQGSFDSITDIGVKPTVSEAQLPAAETFLLHFSGDLYEQPCRVELLHFLRDEQKFPDVDSLYRQIAQDQKQCQEWLKQHDL